jgi:flagellar hook assembly protein FlgD
VWARPFSPNGDGVRDTTVIHLRLPRWADNVRLEIGRESRPGRPFRVVELGRLSKGTHTWTWDGRRDDGSMVGNNTFRAEVVSSPDRWAESAGPVVVDRAFSPGIAPSVQYSLPPAQPPAVFPRTTVVSDHITLEDTGVRTYPERPAAGLKNLRLEIRDRAGRVVLRHPMSRKSEEQPYFSYDWTARVNGRPLAPGRYRAVVNGRDAAGNHGPGVPLLLWVSRDRLEWREETYTVEPATSSVASCFFDGGAGCGDPGVPSCGTVAASDRYPGGLSYRSGACAPMPDSPMLVAGRTHWFPLLDAVPGRGIASARVAFRGSPTYASESDQGTLSVLSRNYGEGVTVTSSTGAETADVEPRYWNGVPYGEYNELVQPGVAWAFATHGDDAVDVDRFLVTARYLARASD